MESRCLSPAARPGGVDRRTLRDPEALLALPAFGLSCPVGALYAGTHLRPRRRA